MTPDAPAPDTVLLTPTDIDPAVVRVAAPAARAAARRFVGRHDIDFTRRHSEADDETAREDGKH